MCDFFTSIFSGQFQSLAKEQSLLRDREQQKIRENAELSSRLAETEKVKASLESEAKSLATRYEQLVKSQNANENALINNKTEASVEQLKSLESKLSEEKQARSRLESRFQEKDREMSMITVDYRQLQYKLDKLEAENRQECDKARNLGTQVSQKFLDINFFILI